MKAKLISYQTISGMYKGEPYSRCTLTFRFWFIKWSIIYDLTCFDDWRSYYNYWDSIIEEKSNVKFSAIKARKNF